VLAWGANGSGQLGDGTVYTKNLTSAPVLIDDVTPPTFSSIHLDRSIVGTAAQVTLSKNVSDADSGVSSVTASVRGASKLKPRRPRSRTQRALDCAPQHAVIVNIG
jgi:hypothetical protein